MKITKYVAVTIAVTALAAGGGSAIALSARGHSPAREVARRPVAARQVAAPRRVTASWHDGYRHFVLTIDPALLITRTAAHRAASARTGPTSTSEPGAAPGGVDSSGTGNGWQADAYNPAYPVVWRPGQHVSVMVQAMRAFPKGTAIQRDANGDIQAVIDRPARKAASATPAEVVKALSAMPGVHSADLVWGDRYEVATTLPVAAWRKVAGVRAVLPNNPFVTQATTPTSEPLPTPVVGAKMSATGDPYGLGPRGTAATRRAGPGGGGQARPSPAGPRPAVHKARSHRRGPKRRRDQPSGAASS